MSKDKNPASQTPHMEGGDNQPRYTTKRMRDEIAKARAYGMEQAASMCIDRAAEYDASFEDTKYKTEALAGSAALVAIAGKIREQIANQPSQQHFEGIRSLDWEAIGSGFFRAPAPLFGNIRVEKYGSLFTTCYSLPGYSNTFAEGAFATADEAKAACEAEYQKRMRAALASEGSDRG